MHIVISGKHLDIGETLKTYTTESIQQNIKKYFANIVNIHITIGKDKDSFHTNIAVNDGPGIHMINSDASDSDAYKSVDKAIKKIEKQLEKYKARIKNHRKTKYNDLPLEAKKYIISDLEDEEINSVEEDNPTIIAEKPIQVKVLSVRDAVMHMNLQNVPAMVFVNGSNYKLSLVYKRTDGNIAWVDTSVDMSQQVSKVE
jgi:ribosomal subunit interface protein